jgi:hypothetical protein
MPRATHHFTFPNAERRGDKEDHASVVVIKFPRHGHAPRHWLRSRTEEWLAALLCLAGLMWSAQRINLAVGPNQSLLPTGALQVCILGVLVWGHARWRRFARR